MCWAWNGSESVAVEAIEAIALHTLCCVDEEEGRGSYVYRKTWHTPDHILLSAGLFDGRGFVYEKGSFRVLRSSHLVDEKTGFPKYRRGDGWLYSDHLPLLVTLGIARKEGD